MSIFLLEKISKIFKTGSGDFYALKDVSISFPSTGLISIVGKSGSGKSTLLNILLGIEKPSSGVLKFNGKQINKMSDKAFSKYHLNDVSMVFQHYNIFSELSAKENVMLPLLMKGYSKSKADKIVTKYFNDFSLDYLIGQKASLLSGGEKQRIAILRAIVTSPKVILCDEPTGALDSKNSLAIMEMLKELSKKILVVHVSHNKTYCSEIFLTSIDDSSLFFETIKKLKDSNSTFQIESNAYDIQQSYKTFIDSFSTALFVFVIISFIGVNFILGMISLSAYIENKKNSAILTCLGARQRSIQSIYLTQNYLLIFISIVLSIALSLVSQIVLNNIISKRFALDSLISIPFSTFYNVPFGLILFLLVIALFFSTIFTLTPMLIYRHISLSDELRDE